MQTISICVEFPTHLHDTYKLLVSASLSTTRYLFSVKMFIVCVCCTLVVCDRFKHSVCF
jgi:hypothetical protein